MIKLPLGGDSWFAWCPPAPGDAPDGYVTLAIQWAGGTKTYTLAAMAPCEVTVVASDRRTLTVEWPDSGDSVPVPVPPAGWRQWYPAPALVVLGGQCQAPVTVLRAVVDETGTGALVLSEPVPDTIVAGASVRWLAYAVEIPSEDLPSAPERPVVWTVSYTASRWGLEHGAVVHRGVLAVVRAPFATGLTDATFRASYASLVLPAGQTSWAPQIAVALDALTARIEQSSAAGVYADQLAGGQFLRAHTLLTAILICDDLLARGVDRSALRDRLAKDLDAELARALARPQWLDADDDGTATGGETTPARYSVPARSHIVDDATLPTRVDVGGAR